MKSLKLKLISIIAASHQTDNEADYDTLIEAAHETLLRINPFLNRSSRNFIILSDADHALWRAA